MRSLIMLMLLLGFGSCNQSDEIRGSDDDLTIERQEEYKRDTESDKFPLQRDDRLNVDEDELELSE